MASEAEPAASPPDPGEFSAERFDANLRALVAFGARPAGSAALATASEWALASVHESPAGAPIVIVAQLRTSAAHGAALAEASSGAALVLEVARALAARGKAVPVAFVAEELVPPQALARAEAAVYVGRACGLPQRRDLLSHRVLRERFFRVAGVEPIGFEQSDAPHAELHAAGAKRVVALDAPLAGGAACAPAGFGDALLNFVSEVTALLSRRHDE